MNQACVRNDTIDAGNHHGRPQYRSFLRFLTSQETQRHLAVAGRRFSSGGRHHAWPVRAVLVANQSGAVRRVLPMQLAATAHRSQPVPANVPPTGGLHNPVHPGMAEVRHPPQRRVHEHHRIAGRARHFGCDRPCVRHQTHSVAYAIADSHRIILGFLRSGRRAMAVPSVCAPNR